MESRPATRAKTSRERAPPPCSCLPEEIIVWEILVRLPPKSLLLCRAVCRSWHRATSTRYFLLAHHDNQPYLSIILGEAVRDSDYGGTRYEDFLTFDHRAVGAELQRVARHDASFNLESSCNGLLVLSKRDATVTRLFICNPITREHAPLLVDCSLSSLLAMYRHRPTGEYRLLLHRMTCWGSFAGSLLTKGKIGCYVFVPGTDQPPRYIQEQDAAAGLCCRTPSRVHDSLHWFPHQHQSKSRMVLVFDTSESFRQIHAPVVLPTSDIFEMDDTLGIYSYNIGMQVVDIWVLQNYEAEVWVYKYNVKLPAAEIRGKFGGWNDNFYRSIVSVDGDVLLLLSHGGWMFYVNTDGKLVDSFHRDGQRVYATNLRLKQTLVPHNFFRSVEDSSVNASPFL